MPTITIKQFDNTSAGVLRQPKNVFLIGPKDTSITAGDDAIKADINGVYYFTSYSDFKTTIGECTPEEYTYSKDGVTDKCMSYGNQMAAELLNLGYNVYYYCIEDFTTVVNKATDWDWLTDISLYPIDYIVTGFVGAGCYDLITALRYKVEARSGDCLLLVDMPTEDTYLKCIDSEADNQVPGTTASIAEGEADSEAEGDGETETGVKVTSGNSLLAKLAAETSWLVVDKYCATFAPVCEIPGLSTSGAYSNKILPASFNYLACAINAEENLGYKDWFAVAGLTRGRRSDLIATPTVAFGDRDATICAPRTTQADTSYKFNYAINLVARQAGGFYIWGNRTGHALTEAGLTAEHFLNIQRLCMSLKKQIYSTCKKLTFDPNSDILWSNFVGGIEPLLKDMQANQGINGYKIIRVKNANDPKAMMRARIRIVPIEAVEDFEIEISLEDLIEA